MPPVRVTDAIATVLAVKDGRVQVRNGGLLGWLEQDDVLQLGTADAYFTAKIRENPDDLIA